MKCLIRTAYYVLYIIFLVSGIPQISWIKQEIVCPCLEEDIKLNFQYKFDNLTVDFDKISAATWFFKTNPSANPVYICYISKNGFQYVKENVERIGRRVIWENNTLNLQLMNVTEQDSGYYDLTFTASSQTYYTANSDGTIELRVKDPCVTGKVVKDGCTELSCKASGNSEYTWNGQGVNGSKSSTVTVCPTETQTYKCCKNQTNCVEFQASAADKHTKQTSSGIKTGIIVGIVLGVIGTIALIFGIICYCQRKGEYHAPSDKEEL